MNIKYKDNGREYLFDFFFEYGLSLTDEEVDEIVEKVYDCTEVIAENEITPEHFKTFLKRHRALKKFLNNNPVNHVYDLIPQAWILCGLQGWYDTNEGNRYWFHLNALWLKEIKRIKAKQIETNK